MSKKMTPKERLDKLSTKQIAIDLFNIVSNGKYDMNNLVNYFDRIDEALAELEEFKRYPTADEVCKALSEQLKTQIKIGKNKHGITFNYAETGKKIISLNYDLIHINVQLPYNLITLIGRFYEGLEEQ